MSRILEGLFALRGLFRRGQPLSELSHKPFRAQPPALPPVQPRPQQISVQGAVPAHLVASVTEELNFRVQRILQRAVAEEEALALPMSASTLVMVGLRIDEPGLEAARMLH